MHIRRLIGLFTCYICPFNVIQCYILKHCICAVTDDDSGARLLRGLKDSLFLLAVVMYYVALGVCESL